MLLILICLIMMRLYRHQINDRTRHSLEFHIPNLINTRILSARTLTVKKATYNTYTYAHKAIEKEHKQKRLFCLTIKSDIDFEVDRCIKKKNRADV